MLAHEKVDALNNIERERDQCADDQVIGRFEFNLCGLPKNQEEHDWHNKDGDCRSSDPNPGPQHTVLVAFGFSRALTPDKLETAERE